MFYPCLKKRCDIFFEKLVFKTQLPRPAKCVWLEALGFFFPNTLGHILEAHVTNCASTCIACSFLEYARSCSR